MPIFYAINQNPYSAKESVKKSSFINNLIHKFGG